MRIFSEILNFFEKWNNWGGWGIFIGMFIMNVTLFLPGVALILGAGFVFGCVPFFQSQSGPRSSETYPTQTLLSTQKREVELHLLLVALSRDIPIGKDVSDQTNLLQ